MSHHENDTGKDIEMKVKTESEESVKEGQHKDKDQINIHEHEHKHKKDHKKEEDINKLEKEIQKLKDENEKLQNDNVLFKESYARKVAEFDNYKKRMLKEMDNFRLMANKDFIMEIIPIFDNFRRAFVSSEQNKDFDKLFEGLKVVQAQILNMFNKMDVKPIDAIGKEFDHNLHEALLMEEREDIDFDTTVIEEFEKGYILGDTVIKHSKVKVAKKKSK